MQNNTYDDDVDCHFTFLVGECGDGEKIDNVWVDMSGYLKADGTAEVYFDDGYNGYILDEHRYEKMIDLPYDILEKLEELTERAVLKERAEPQAEYGE